MFDLDQQEISDSEQTAPTLPVRDPQDLRHAVCLCVHVSSRSVYFLCLFLLVCSGRRVIFVFLLVVVFLSLCVYSFHPEHLSMVKGQVQSGVNKILPV